MSDFSNMTPAEKAELVDLVIAQMAATSKVAFKPIDMDNLEHLDETGDWPAEIVQLMPGNAVSAGAPDPANNKGTINWPLRDLAIRTAINRAALGGIGGTVEAVADLDAMSKTGPRQFAAGAVGAPQNDKSGFVEHVESGGATAWQIVMHTDGSQYSRTRTSNDPVTWTAWGRNWAGGDAGALFSGSGYQIFPSGMILQWGSVTVGTRPFPIVFPNACLNAVGCDNGDGSINSVGVNFTAANITLGSADAGTVRYIAIGH